MSTIHRVVIFVLALLFLPGAGIAASDQPIVIGGSLGLTGKYEKLALMQQRGFELWQKQINQQGGLLGRPVELLIRDDQSDKKRAVEIYSNLLEKDKVDLLFAPYSSGITNAIMPVIEHHQIPLLASGAAADSLWEQGYQNLFGLFIPASRYAVGFLEMVALNEYTEIAIVGADDLFSRTIASGAKRWAEEFGLKIALLREFPKGQHDLTAVAKEIATHSIDVVVVAGHFNESVDMTHALNQIQYQPKAYFATIGPALEKYHQTLGPLAEGSFSSLQWSSKAMHRKEDKDLFLAPFIDAYGVEPSYHAAQAYAAGQVLTAAVEQNQSLDRDLIRETLSSFNTFNVIGRYGVDQKGRQVRHFAQNSQWQEGQLEVVWPDNQATARPYFRR